MHKLPDTEQSILDTVRRISEKYLAPVAAEVDETDTIPGETLGKMAEAGLFGLLVPGAHGGIFHSHLLYYWTLRELAKSCAAHAITLLSHSMCTHAISTFGTDDQKAKYLPQLASGDHIGGVCMTEKEAGSDLSAIKTIARPHAGGYLINGAKYFITNGGTARVFVVVADTSEKRGPFSKSLFLVDAEREGVCPGRPDNKMGFRGADTRELSFDNVRVPEDSLMGKTGQGMLMISKVLETSRTATAAMALGLAERGFGLALGYAKRRKQFGKPIARFGVIQNYLSDMATDTACAELLIENAALGQKRGLKIAKESAMAKCFASEMACRVLSNALQIHGGRGYMKEYQIERLLRDARLCTIIEGTNEIQRRIIAGNL
jgi:butyryl-CoA dehydrogenase